MALSYVTYSGGAVDGIITDFSVPMAYLEQAHVLVYLDGVLKTLTTDYTWFNSTTIKFNTAPIAATVVHFRRTTPSDARLVDFQDAGNLTEFDLDTSDDQNFYLSQEAQDDFADNAMNLDTDDKWEASSHKIKNVAAGVDATDVANTAQVTAVTALSAASEAAAAVSAAAALVSENAAAADLVLTDADTVATAADRVVTTADKASTTASAAAASASAVSAAADEVLTDADAAATAADAVTTGNDAIATAADAIATAADAVSTGNDVIATAADAVSVAASWDDFDDRYLGAKSSAPTLDNDGDALEDGALYWNTTTKEMNTYNIGDTTWYSMDGLSKTLADTYYAPIGGGHAIEHFTSAGVTPAASTTFTYTHGLSGTPDFVGCYVECTTADKGYAVGDRVWVQKDYSYVGLDYGASPFGNATQVGAVCGDNFTTIWDKAVHSNAAITFSSWTLYVTGTYYG